MMIGKLTIYSSNNGNSNGLLSDANTLIAGMSVVKVLIPPVELEVGKEGRVLLAKESLGFPLTFLRELELATRV